jgi:hypothetical protein
VADGFGAGQAAELVDQGVGAGVLPDDRVPDRRAGGPVPEQRGLPLVGDAERGDLVLSDAGPAQCLGREPLDVAPDLGGVVLDPARLREVLLVLLLGERDKLTVAVEDDAPGGCGALIDGDDLSLGHAVPPQGS